MLRPPLSVRVLAVCVLGPSVAFLFVIGIGAVIQSPNNWPSTIAVVAVAGIVGLVLVNALISGISTQDGTLVIHGLRRRQLPLSTVAELRETPSKYPGLQLLGFVGTDGRILFQLLPIWDAKAVALWAAREGIHFAKAPPRRGSGDRCTPAMGGWLVMDVAAPIVVQNRGEVILFDSLQDAQLWMEAIDVRNNEYEIFDSTGLQLDPRVVTGRIETVQISIHEPRVGDLSRLRGILFDFVVREGKALPDQGSKMQVDDLIALIKEH